MTNKKTRDDLQGAADAAQSAVGGLENELSARREEFQALLAAGEEVDALAFRQRQDADQLRLTQLRLTAARAELALLEHDAEDAGATHTREYAALRALEAEIDALNRKLNMQRTTQSRAAGRLSSLNDRRKVLQEEERRLQQAILNAVDGKVSTLRPVPTGFGALA